MWRSFLLTFFVIGVVGTVVLAWNAGRGAPAEQPAKKHHQTSASSTPNQPANSNSSCVNCNFVSP
jgi:hypothetical protein